MMPAVKFDDLIHLLDDNVTINKIRAKMNVLNVNEWNIFSMNEYSINILINN